jgi:hypothetical protein
LSILENAKSSQEAAIDLGLNWWLMGPPGAGKTTLAGTLALHPKGRKVLIADAEGGAGVLSGFSDVDVVPVLDWPTLGELYKDLSEGEHSYGTVVLDNMSEYRKICTNYSQETSEDPSEKDPDAPALRTWMRSNNKMSKAIRAYRSLSMLRGMNVVFISWSGTEKDQRTGAVTIEPEIAPALQSEVPGIVDVFAFLQRKDDGTPILLLHGTQKVPSAKFRRRDSAAWTIPDEIENPSLAPILEVIREGTEWSQALKKYPFIHPKEIGR